MKSLVRVFLLLACVSGQGCFAHTSWNDVERFASDHLPRRFNSSETDAAQMITEISGVWQRTNFSAPPIRVHLEAAYLIQFIATERSYKLDDQTLEKMAAVFLDNLSSTRPRSMEALMELPFAFALSDLQRIVQAVGLNNGRLSHQKLFFLINRAEKDADFVARLKNASNGPSTFWKEIELQILSNIEKFSQNIETESPRRTTPSRRYREDAVELFGRMRKIDPTIEDRVFAPVKANWQKQMGKDENSATPLPHPPEKADPDAAVQKLIEDLLAALLRSEVGPSRALALDLFGASLNVLSAAQLKIAWKQLQERDVEPATQRELTALVANQVRHRVGEALQRVTEMGSQAQSALMVGCLNLLIASTSDDEPAAAPKP